VAEENRDREVIMRRVLSADGSLEERDAPLVRRIFYRLNSQAARPGDRVQREDGSWEVRAGGTESKGQRTGEQDAGDRRQATGNQG
jgi:hypothetical protein